jgi:hypothetical protein
MRVHWLFLLATIAAFVGCASMEAMPKAASMAYDDGDWDGVAAEAEETYVDDGGSPYSDSAPSDRRARAGLAMSAPAPAPGREMRPPGEAPAPEPTASTGSTEPTSDKNFEAAKRLIIYTGSLTLMVPQTEVAIDAFLTHVKAGGGYLQGRSGGSITVRVPADLFFATVDWARKNGTVSDEQVNAADVTKRVFDLELRLQTADEARKRLLKLLETATVMADILAIEAQLRRLTDEIEGMKGELRNLGDQIAFSTLTVNFYADAPSPTPYPRRVRSRFPWINSVGIERVLANF